MKTTASVALASQQLLSSHVAPLRKVASLHTCGEKTSSGGEDSRGCTRGGARNTRIDTNTGAINALSLLSSLLFSSFFLSRPYFPMLALMEKLFSGSLPDSIIFFTILHEDSV